MAALHGGQVYFKMDECDAVDLNIGGRAMHPVWTLVLHMQK